MLQNTTHVKQVMSGSDARGTTGPNNDTDLFVIHAGDETTVQEWMPGQGEMLADDAQGDYSTVSTDLSRDRRVFSTPPSPLRGAETDPTSMPSGVLDDLDLGRKCTESPLESIEAVHGSDSVHSEQYDSSTGSSESRERVSVAVNAGKVTAVGDHFGESSTEASTQRFHDPNNSWEAQRINDKIVQTTGNSIRPAVSQSWSNLLCSYLGRH